MTNRNDEEVVIDWEGALETTGGDSDLLKIIVDAALEEIPGLYSQLEESITGGDAKTSQRLAHTIKGSARALSAVKTEKAGTAIEEAAENGDLAAAKLGMRHLQETIQELICECNEFKARS